MAPPAENWLPITREDLDMVVMIRVYVPDLQKTKTCVEHIVLCVKNSAEYPGI